MDGETWQDLPSDEQIQFLTGLERIATERGHRLIADACRVLIDHQRTEDGPADDRRSAS